MQIRGEAIAIAQWDQEITLDFKRIRNCFFHGSLVPPPTYHLLLKPVRTRKSVARVPELFVR
jgi:hypothetical protein